MMSELDYTKKSKGSDAWKRKLAAMLLFSNDMWWMNYNEMPTETKKMLKDIADFWRTKQLLEDNCTLGLGVPGDVEISKKAHEALMSMLKDIQKRVEWCGLGFKFPCNLGKKRGRHTSKKTAVDRPAKRSSQKQT